MAHSKTTKTQKAREKNFGETLRSVQQDLPPISRAFSKVIHNKTIETVSDIVGNTIARPNAILAGGICAFLLVAVVYAIARYTGFTLSGSETILAFTAGWLVGLLFDLVRGAFSRKQD